MSETLYVVEEKDAVQGWVKGKRTQKQIDSLRNMGVEVRVIGESESQSPEPKSKPWTHWGQ